MLYVNVHIFENCFTMDANKLSKKKKYKIKSQPKFADFKFVIVVKLTESLLILKVLYMHKYDWTYAYLGTVFLVLFHLVWSDWTSFEIP